ncbi:MAG: hypothetical protein RLZZ63_362, partial [Gemmatimonadota bacterium]
GRGGPRAASGVGDGATTAAHATNGI